MTDAEYEKHAREICDSLLSRTQTSIECIEIALIVLRSVIKSCPDGAMRIQLFEDSVKQLRIDLDIDNLIKPPRLFR